MLGAGALGWGGRWEEGSGWGTNLHPVVDPCQCMAKPLQYCKVISLQLIKINKKKKNKSTLFYRFINMLNYML